MSNIQKPTIGGNILALGSSEIIARIIAFVGIAYIARQLGPEQFGIIGFAAALFSYLALAVTGGFNDVGAREIARRPHRAASIAASVIVVRLVLAFAAIIVFGLVVWFLNKPPTVKIVVLLTGLLFFSLALDTSWVYKGLERNRPVGLSLILGQILYVGLMLLVVNAPNDVEFVPIAQFLGEMSAVFVLALPLFRLGKFKINWRKGFDIFRNSIFWTVSRLMRTLMYSFDVVLIGFLLGEYSVGLYNAAYRVCFLLVALAVSIHASYLPIMTRAAHADSTKVEIGKIAERSINLAAAIAAPLVVGGMIISEPLLINLFGSEYAEGADALRFLLLSIGFVFIHGAIHNIFLVCNRLKTEMVIFMAATVVNVGLNIFVIPRYGIFGAAFVTAAAEAVVLVLGLIVITKIGVSFSLRPVWRPLLASGVMGAGLFLLGANQSLILYLAVGGAAYFLALILLRGIPADMNPLVETSVLFVKNLRGNSN